MPQKKGLGRSFDSLLPTELINETLDPTASVDEKISQLRHVPVSKIQPDKNQPRHVFDEAALDELAASIKEHGILQPLVVVEKDGGFQIVAGERRWRASKKAGIKEIPVIVRTLSDQHKLEISLIENLQRKDLNVLETATAYLKLRDQFNMKLNDIANRAGGKSVAAVSNVIRLLQLPANAKKALIEHEITEGHARQILALEDGKIQDTLLGNILKKNWSVRQAEQFVIGYKKGRGSAKKENAVRSTLAQTPMTINIEKRLKTKVRVKTTAKGGQLLIHFKDSRELERISDLLSK